MPISGPGTKIPGVKDAETPVPTAFKKVRAGDRVVLLLTERFRVVCKDRSNRSLDKVI